MECFRLTREMSEDGRRELARKLADYRRIVVSVSGKDADVVAYADFLAGLDLSVPLVYAFFTSYSWNATVRACFEPSQCRSAGTFF